MNYLSCTCYKVSVAPSFWMSSPSIEAGGELSSAGTCGKNDDILGVRCVFKGGIQKGFPIGIWQNESAEWSEMRDHFTLKARHDTWILHGFLKGRPPFRWVPSRAFLGAQMSHFHPFPTYSDGDHGYVWRLNVDGAGCWCWFCVAGSEWG